MAKESKFDEAKRRFKRVSEFWDSQREREREALKFQVPSMQWDDSARRAREGAPGPGESVIPPRPCLSIDKLSQPRQIVMNQERAARLGVSIHPLGPDANDDTAEMQQGLYRTIERNSQAHVARSWAFERAVTVGRGAYRVGTRYCDDPNFPFDQEITIERIFDQDMVFFDPGATKPDYSDGEFAFCGGWVSQETFDRLYPGADETPVEGDAFKDAVANEPSWVREDGEGRAYLVMEYFYKVHESQTIYQLQTGEIVEEKPVDKAVVANTRVFDQMTVHRCVLNGFEILEENDLDGTYIPLVPTIGKELHPMDEQRRYLGMIEPNMDAQRMYNYAASSAVELVALEPKAPFIGAAGQFDGYESDWQQANTRNWPYLQYNPTSFEGQALPPPNRVQVDQSRLGPTMMLLQQADAFIQAGTQQFDASLGRMSGKERSGKAILAQIDQSDASNSHFMHNLADVSMALEARIVLDLIPHIYDRPGRIEKVLDIEDKTQSVMLNAPFVTGQDGVPQQVPPGQPAPPGQEVKNYDLTKGSYGVSVTIGKSHQSRLEAGSAFMTDIINADPSLMPVIGPLAFKYRDEPGAKEIADLMLKVREHQMPWLNEDSPGTPEQLQAENAQLKQQLDQAQQQMQQMQQALQTNQAKQQATIQKAQIDSQTKLQTAQMDQQTQLMLAQLEGRIRALEGVGTHSKDMQVAETQAAGDIAKEQVKAQATVAAADLNYKQSLTTPLPSPDTRI